MIPFLDAALQTSALALASLAACALLRRASAAVRHWVLAVAFACMALLPVLEAGAPAWSFPGGAVLGITSAPDQREAGGGPAAPAPVLDDELGVSAQLPSPPAPLNASASGLRALSRWIVPLWASGAAISLLVLLSGLARLRWWANRACRLERGPWTDIARDVSGRLGLTRPVELLRGGPRTVIVTWGVVHPKLLLPEGAEDWDRNRIEIVLAHELQHVGRADWGVQMVALVVRSLYWFNPLVWRMYARLTREGEHACDDGVLNAGIDARGYASELLALARDFNACPPACSAATPIVRPSSLERRIRTMLIPRIDRTPVSRRMLAATIVAVVSLALPIAGFQVTAESFGSLSGSVADPQGRPVAEVTLSLSNPAKRSRYEVRSGEDGRFEFVGLPPGDYVLAAERFAFRRVEQRLTIAGDLQRDIAMQLETVQETIVVAGQASVEPPVHRIDVTTTEASRVRLERARQACRASSGVAAASDVKPPIKVRHVRPVFPSHLHADGTGGIVNVVARIGTDGSVVDVVPLASRAHADLIAAAVEAVSQWQFEPTLLNCEPVEVSMNVAIEFKPMPPPPPDAPPAPR